MLVTRAFALDQAEANLPKDLTTKQQYYARRQIIRRWSSECANIDELMEHNNNVFALRSFVHAAIALKSHMHLHAYASGLTEKYNNIIDAVYNENLKKAAMNFDKKWSSKSGHKIYEKFKVNF
jgi:hypothetical protein